MSRRAGALVLLLAVTACSGDQEQSVERAARALSDLVAAGDVEQACSLLAPASRQELETTEGADCATALSRLDLERVDAVRAVERYGRQASVVVESADGQRDTWFLSRFDGRWLLVAASCTPREPLPYACDLEGP